MDQNNLILVERHFCSNCHNLNKNVKFINIEIIEIDMNIRLKKNDHKMIKKI